MRRLGPATRWRRGPRRSAAGLGWDDQLGRVDSAALDHFERAPPEAGGPAHGRRLRPRRGPRHTSTSASPTWGLAGGAAAARRVRRHHGRAAVLRRDAAGLTGAGWRRSCSTTSSARPSRKFFHTSSRNARARLARRGAGERNRHQRDQILRPPPLGLHLQGQSFSPRGRERRNNAARQPIWLTVGDDNPNGRGAFLARRRGLRTCPSRQCRESRFCADDEEAVADAAALWKPLRPPATTAPYWQQSAVGKWEKEGLADSSETGARGLWRSPQSRGGDTLQVKSAGVPMHAVAVRDPGGSTYGVAEPAVRRRAGRVARARCAASAGTPSSARARTGAARAAERGRAPGSGRARFARMPEGVEPFEHLVEERSRRRTVRHCRGRLAESRAHGSEAVPGAAHSRKAIAAVAANEVSGRTAPCRPPAALRRPSRRAFPAGRVLTRAKRPGGRIPGRWLACGAGARRGTGGFLRSSSWSSRNAKSSRSRIRQPR